MVTFEIYFSDLSKKAQRELMELVHINDPSEMNWDMDICPLAVYETEEDDETTETEWFEPDEGYVVMMKGGRVCHKLTRFKTEDEAIEFCKDNNWVWIDENEFEWDLFIKD